MEELIVISFKRICKNGYIIIYFLGEHTLLRIYPKLPQIVYRTTYWHWWYHYAIRKESVTIFQNTHQDYKGSQNNNYNSYKL